MRNRILIFSFVVLAVIAFAASSAMCAATWGVKEFVRSGGTFAGGSLFITQPGWHDVTSADVDSLGQIVVACASSDVQTTRRFNSSGALLSELVVSEGQYTMRPGIAPDGTEVFGFALNQYFWVVAPTGTTWSSYWTSSSRGGHFYNKWSAFDKTNNVFYNLGVKSGGSYPMSIDAYDYTQNFKRLWSTVLSGDNGNSFVGGGVVVDETTHNIFVDDTGMDHAIKKLDSSGAVLASWTSVSGPGGTFDFTTWNVTGMTFDSVTSNLLVSVKDGTNPGKMLVLDANGSYLGDVAMPGADTVNAAGLNLDGSKLYVPGLWNPVPEPSSILALMAGMTGLAGLAHRRRGR